MEKYGFYGRLKEDFPSQFIVDVIEDCTLACLACPHSEFKKSEHYSGARLDPELNRKLVDEVKKLGGGKTEYIRYAANGEPLLHKSIIEMLKYAVDNSGTLVTLTTNGTIMNDNKADLIIDAGVDIIDISIDAFKDETYAIVRKGGNLEVTRKNVLNLIKKSKENGARIKVVVSFVETDLNRNEADDFKKYWELNGADYVVIRRMHSCSGAKSELANITRENNADILRRPCLYPWERLVLNARGELAYCPSDWVHGSVLADYRITSVQEIWNGKKYKNLRDAHLKNDYKDFPFCGQCPDWIATRWPDEGRSYADMVEEFKEKE